MPKQILLKQFTNDLFQFLDETFEHVQGIYLDKGTSLFETLDTITAEEASRPVSATCASIAGQVEHVRFYIDVLEKYLHNQPVGQIDWQTSWSLKTVTPDEWDALKQRLHADYRQLVAELKKPELWDGEDTIA